METVLTGAASNARSSVATLAITPLIVMIDDLIHLDQNRQLLQHKLTSTRIVLQDISNQFQRYQGSPPGTVTYWSQKLQQSLQKSWKRMELFRGLKEKNFLIVLDDMWSSLDLHEEVGIPVGNEKGSRVIISTRSTEVIRRMGANEYSIQLKPLSEKEKWELFCRKAFKDGPASTKGIEDVARVIVRECKGLPLAINVVAPAVMGNATVDEWNLALSQMQNVDSDFLTSSGIDKGLQEPLQWSYNRLPDSNYQNCFLYCGAFPEDAKIEVEALVEMWTGERLVRSRGKNYLMDKGRGYVKLLVERCLFEDVEDSMGNKCIKVHDVVRDMAIHIAENENCIFRTKQNLQQFSVENETENAKRIAIGYNEIPFLPPVLRCPKLPALLLGSNESFREIPNGFFLNLVSLRVLDMSCTNIESLPISMWHLTQVEFLGLSSICLKTYASLAGFNFCILRTAGS